MCMQVVILPKFMFNLPRGKHRTLLKKAGRILSLQFKRSMTSPETKNQILRGFNEIGDLDTWTVLETTDNRLAIGKNQALDGGLWLIVKAVPGLSSIMLLFI